MNSILRKAGDLGLSASAGHPQIRECEGQPGGLPQEGEPYERNPCAPSFEEQPPEETSRQVECTSKVAWNLARKCQDTELNVEQRLISSENARDTEDCMFVVHSGALNFTVLSKEN